MAERRLIVLAVLGVVASATHTMAFVREAIGFAYAAQLIRWRRTSTPLAARTAVSARHAVR